MTRLPDAALDEGGVQLSARACALIREVRAEMSTHGRDDLLSRLVDLGAGDKSRDVFHVVVAGEAGSGKSQLINALLGSERLPAGIDASTSTLTLVEYAEVEGMVVELADGSRNAGLPVADIWQWVTEEANPGNVLGVTLVTIGLPLEVLRELTLIDTPAGSLTGAAGVLVPDLLHHSDGVMFAVDTSRPITAPEIAFLSEVAGGTTYVCHVGTKTDASQDWQKVFEANRDAIRKHLPEVAAAWPDDHAVSSVLFLATRGQPFSELAQESNIERLQAVVLGRLRQRAAMAPLVRALTWAAYAHASHLRGIKAPASDRPSRKHLYDERRQLTAIVTEGTWSRGLSGGSRKILLQAIRDLSEVMGGERRKYEALALVGGAPASALSDLLIADVAEAWRKLASQISKSIDDLVTEVSSNYAGTSSRFDRALLHADTDGLTDVVPLPALRQKAEDNLRLVGTWSSGRSMSSAVLAMAGDGISGLGMAGLGSSGPLGWITVGGGTLFALLSHHFRRRSSAQLATQQWVRECFANATAALTTDLQRCMIDVEEQLRSAVGDELRSRLRGLNAEIAGFEEDREPAQAAADTSAELASRLRVCIQDVIAHAYAVAGGGKS